jgi:hypothetical protein
MIEYRDDAKVEVTKYMHLAHEADDCADYETWLNVSLCRIAPAIRGANRQKQ